MGKEGEKIEEGKERKGRGRNVAFHHLLLSNLTTVSTLTFRLQPVVFFIRRMKSSFVHPVLSTVSNRCAKNRMKK